MTRTIAFAIAAATLAASATVMAQADEHRTEMTRADVETRTAARFDRMDANNDGQLDAADREARARERFAAADANGDGLLSFEEMQARGAEQREQRAERREQAGERDGRRGHRMGRRGHRGGAMMRERSDTDNDGAISAAEFTAAALARFDQLDANGDGTVTADEHRAQRHEQMQNRRESRQAQ